MKIKRIIAAIMAVVVVGVNYGTAGYQYGSGSSAFAADTAAAEKEDTVEVDGMIFKAVEGGYALDGVSSEITDLVIPDEVNGCPVVAVKSVDKIKKTITSVKFGKNVKTIEPYVFKGCSTLKSAEFNDGLEVIGSEAFRHSGLSSPIVIPASVKAIEDGAFQDCPDLRRMMMYSADCELGDHFADTNLYGYKDSTAAAYGERNAPKFLNIFPSDEMCSTWDFFDIEDKSIPLDIYVQDGVHYYPRSEGGYKVFYTDEDVTELVIPDEVNGYPVVEVTDKFSAGEGLFKRLTSLKLGKSIRILGTYAFENCTKLTEVELNDALEIIGPFSFRNCPISTPVVLPESVKEIGDYSFNDTDGVIDLTVLSKDCTFVGANVIKTGITGYKGSTAEAYAEKNGLAFTEIQSVSEKLGDTNCDGNVELADAILILQSLASPDIYGEQGSYKKHLTAQGKKNGDVDKSIVGLTANDALYIQQYLLRVRPSLEPET